MICIKFCIWNCCIYKCNKKLVTTVSYSNLNKLLKIIVKWAHFYNTNAQAWVCVKFELFSPFLASVYVHVLTRADYGHVFNKQTRISQDISQGSFDFHFTFLCWLVCDSPMLDHSIEIWATFLYLAWIGTYFCLP